MNVLLNNLGIEKALLFMGIAVMAISMPIAQLIKNPPAGYTPPAPGDLKQTSSAKTSVDVTWREMVKTKQFYLLFVMFLLSSSVGLMIIGNMSKIANTQIGITDTTLLAILVSFLAITNTAGRVLGGIMSDKIGRVNALLVVFALQSLNMACFVFHQNMPALITSIILVGFCYGTLLSVFPTLIADLYGLKNYGTNYGVLYLAWGLAGVVAPIAADIIYDMNGNFHTAYFISAIMMALLVCVNILFRKTNRF
jgi:MFS family permease